MNIRIIGMPEVMEKCRKKLGDDTEEFQKLQEMCVYLEGRQNNGKVKDLLHPEPLESYILDGYIYIEDYISLWMYLDNLSFTRKRITVKGDYCGMFSYKFLNINIIEPYTWKIEFQESLKRRI